MYLEERLEHRNCIVGKEETEKVALIHHRITR